MLKLEKHHVLVGIAIALFLVAWAVWSFVLVPEAEPLPTTPPTEITP